MGGKQEIMRLLSNSASHIRYTGALKGFLRRAHGSALLRMFRTPARLMSERSLCRPSFFRVYRLSVLVELRLNGFLMLLRFSRWPEPFATPYVLQRWRFVRHRRSTKRGSERSGSNMGFVFMYPTLTME